MQESILKLYAGQNILQNAAGNLQDFFFCRKLEKLIPANFLQRSAGYFVLHRV